VDLLRHHQRYGSVWHHRGVLEAARTKYMAVVSLHSTDAGQKDDADERYA